MKTFEEWWEENDGGICGMSSCRRAWDAAISTANTPSIGTPPESRYGRGLAPEPKPLAQYLDEYIQHEVELDGLKQEAAGLWMPDKGFFKQALEAYQSTENVWVEITRRK